MFCSDVGPCWADVGPWLGLIQSILGRLESMRGHFWALFSAPKIMYFFARRATFVVSINHNIHIHIYTYTHIYIYTYIHIHIYIYIYTYLHICISTYIHIYKCTYIHIYIYLQGEGGNHVYLYYLQDHIHRGEGGNHDRGGGVPEPGTYISISIYIFLFKFVLIFIYPCADDKNKSMKPAIWSTFSPRHRQEWGSQRQDKISGKSCWDRQWHNKRRLTLVPPNWNQIIMNYGKWNSDHVIF